MSWDRSSELARSPAKLLAINRQHGVPLRVYALIHRPDRAQGIDFLRSKSIAERVIIEEGEQIVALVVGRYEEAVRRWFVRPMLIRIRFSSGTQTE